MNTGAFCRCKHCLAPLKLVEWLAHCLASGKGRKCELLQEESSNADLLGEGV